MATEVTPPRQLLPPTPRKVPQALADLPLPPELQEQLRQWSSSHWFWGRKWRKNVEEELKLQFYYGGWYLRCLKTPQGRVVVALYMGDGEDYQRQLQALSPQEKQRAVLVQPLMWNGLPRATDDLAQHEG